MRHCCVLWRFSSQLYIRLIINNTECIYFMHLTRPYRHEALRAVLRPTFVFL